MESDIVKHYNHLVSLRWKLLDHSWSRSLTNYDAKFIAWFDKEMQKAENEAYHITQIGIETNTGEVLETI